MKEDKSVTLTFIFLLFDLFLTWLVLRLKLWSYILSLLSIT